MRPLRWHFMPRQLVAVVESERERLFLYYGRQIDGATFQPLKNGKYYVLALSSPAGVSTSEDVLQNHAHESLGEFETAKAARGVCARYARVWLKKQRTLKAIERCPCEPINRRRPSKRKK